VALTRSQVPHITMLVRLRRRGLALIAAALVLLSGGTALAQSAGTVIGLSGDCFVVSGGSRAALRLGQPVQVGDILDVAASGKLKLRTAESCCTDQQADAVSLSSPAFR
jgi:hypothetical protein